MGSNAFAWSYLTILNKCSPHFHLFYSMPTPFCKRIIRINTTGKVFLHKRYTHLKQSYKHLEIPKHFSCKLCIPYHLGKSQLTKFSSWPNKPKRLLQIPQLLILEPWTTPKFPGPGVWKKKKMPFLRRILNETFLSPWVGNASRRHAHARLFHKTSLNTAPWTRRFSYSPSLLGPALWCARTRRPLCGGGRRARGRTSRGHRSMRAVLTFCEEEALALSCRTPRAAAMCLVADLVVRGSFLVSIMFFSSVQDFGDGCSMGTLLPEVAWSLHWTCGEGRPGILLERVVQREEHRFLHE